MVPVQAPPVQLEMIMRTPSCVDCLSACCCHCNPSAAAGMCCNMLCCGCCSCKVPDYEKTHQAIERMLAESEEKCAFLSAQRKSGMSLVRTFEAMARNGKVDTLEFSSSRLLDICGTVSAVNDVLAAMAKSMPTAVKIDSAGLLDNNVAAICQLFFENPDLAHFEVSIAPTDLEGIENLQNLIQTRVSSVTLVWHSILQC